jgi:hypothetical protein
MTWDGSVLKRTAVSALVDSAETDSTGRFEFINPDTGVYYIEANDEEEKSAYIPMVEYKGDTLVLDPLVLKHSGALEGKILLHSGADYRYIIILIFGINRFSFLDADSTFHLTGLPEGNYDFQIRTFGDNFDIFDSTVQVLSGQTVQLHVEYPKISTLLPRLISVDYFANSGAVVLRWTRADTSLVRRYLVSRSELLDPWWQGKYSEFELLPPTFSTDQYFRDTNVTAGRTYIYKVDVVLKNETGKNQFYTIGQDTVSIPGGDLIPPEITVHFPEDGYRTDTAEIEISFSITDSSGFFGPEITRNGTRVVSQDQIVASDSADYHYPLTLEYGSNVLEIKTSDLSMNLNYSSISLEVFYDTVAMATSAP